MTMEHDATVLERVANYPMQDCVNSSPNVNDAEALAECDFLRSKKDTNFGESHEYVPSSLKDVLSQEESATPQRMSSSDASGNSPLNCLPEDKDAIDYPPSLMEKDASICQEYAQDTHTKRKQPGLGITQHPTLDSNEEVCENGNARTVLERRELTPSDNNGRLKSPRNADGNEPLHKMSTEPSGVDSASSDRNANYGELTGSSTAKAKLANHSLKSDISLVSSQYTVTKVPKKNQHTLRKSPKKTTSMMARGVSFLAKSPRQTKFAKNDDAISVLSELSQEVKSEKVDKNNDDGLRQHLNESGLVLLKRLLEFLSECPPALDEGTENTFPSGQSRETPIISKQKKRQRGLTLPASAIGWLSTQINDSFDEEFEDDCFQIPQQQLQVLQTLLKRVTSLRISGEAWPSTHSISKATNPEKIGISSKIMSKISGDQLIGRESFDDESCTEPSRVDSNSPEVVVSTFYRYYHELQYKPDVNMAFFPNATKVVIDGIPSHWITNLDSVQNLNMLQMEKSCVNDINQLFFSSDIPDKKIMPDINQNSSILSCIDKGSEKEGFQFLPHDLGKPESASPFVYACLSKLRLSNCAIGEMAGLRGRKNTVPSLPTFSRFPNLLSLNLSHNEMFKTKTAFAGLASLPLLSSINLSYNRLSSLDDIFMHIGNVTELTLTGNCLASTRGLDRLFSLERLSIDENCISNLTNIAGIAMAPFLMNLDLMGNPFFDDPARSRIEVFNLFREIRCKNLPKHATFRDMQRLLPFLDNEISTKDELVALKDLTFRQTVIPVNSNSPQESNESQCIDISSEISVNMPDSISEGIRRIVKSSTTKPAHFRLAGSALRGPERLERFHDRFSNQLERNDREMKSTQIIMTELITSIRPEIHAGDTSTIRERSCSGQFRGTSFSSHQDKDDNAIASSPTEAFPRRLPLALLAEADDDVWTSYSHLDSIIPSHTIWAMPHDDKTEQNAAYELFQENESIERDNGALDTAAKEPSENMLLVSGVSIGSDADNRDERTSDLKARSSMFGGIWEQSYLDNVTKYTKADVDPVNSMEQMVPMLQDFNAAEQGSLYNGPSDYGPLFVSSDLDLYFDSYIFHHDSPTDDIEEAKSKRETAPKIQLFKFDRDLLANCRKLLHGIPTEMNTHERYVGVWKEHVLACGSYARSRLAPVLVPKRGFHGDSVTHAGKAVVTSESRKFILCLSESALYFIIDDDIFFKKSTGGKRTFPTRIPPNSTFNDAHWPHAVACHSLHHLIGISIGFQFQRLTLRFSVGNSAISPSFEYAYVILTSNKLQTVSLLQKLQSHLNDTHTEEGALIDNDDKTFLDALGTPKSNEIVMHYQILHQIWKRGDREASRRVFVLTDSKAYLLDESYFGDGTQQEVGKGKSKELGDVSLAIIDSASLHQVTEVRAANEDPRKITLVILPKTKLKRSHRWRLVCNDGEGAERLIDDVRKATTGY